VRLQTELQSRIIYVEKQTTAIGKIHSFFHTILGGEGILLRYLNGGRSISRGNGVWWPIRHGCTQFTFSVEQLSQKAIKCHFSKIVLIAKNFSGGYFWSLSHGITLFLCQPWNGDLRLTISAGQMYVVTRGNRHWVYGHQLINENENFVKVPLRGWFPKECIDFTTHTAAVDNNNTDAVESSVSDESSEFG